MQQRLPAMIPPAGNLVIELLKSTALVSLITLGDLTFVAQTLKADTLHTPEILSLVLLIYFGVAMVMSRGVRRLGRRLSYWRDAEAR